MKEKRILIGFVGIFMVAALMLIQSVPHALPTPPLRMVASICVGLLCGVLMMLITKLP